ncbi:MAG: hypothetical protein JWN95_2437 [Frankiales bacterium]|nr:hypothetical protein [Frankiales bacterium]
MLRRRWRLLAIIVVAMLTMVACSDVPRSSRPEPVSSVGGEAQVGGPEIAPHAGDEPRAIVSGFLTAAVSSDARHSGSRQFLTADAGGKWQDSTVTVLNDYQVQLPSTSGNHSTVTVTGQRIGQVDAHGVYTPQLKGGGVGDQQSFTFGLSLTNGQWRIDQLQAGVLIRRADFQTFYTARPLYFYDSTETTLVPDLRYSALKDEALAQWLLSQMLSGPRDALGQAVQNEIPDQDQVDPRRATVTISNRTVVDVPGALQLDAQGRQRLAAQLAYSLGTIQFSAVMSLSDGGKAVSIAGLGNVFSTLDFGSIGPDAVSLVPQGFYLRNGGLIASVNDKPVVGPLGAGAYGLTSAAVHSAGTALQVAGVHNNDLLIGTQPGVLTKVTLPPGELSPPDWQPHGSDVWIAVGTSIYGVTPERKTFLISPPATLGGLPAGQIVALRFSPDGVRLAVVLRAKDGTSAIWVGAVARSGTTVSIENFEPLTPAGLVVDDLAWSDATTLLLIGGAKGAEPTIWAVQSDGSFLQARNATGLPRGLQSVAAAPGMPALVGSAGPAVWTQEGGAWASPTRAELTNGSRPFYSS